ncbi:MAG TPA: zinc-ribbon domain containing protein [Solimonas sp.]|nr:zinc-ribbon domain containing protein [Solimonas sp.]
MKSGRQRSRELKTARAGRRTADTPAPSQTEANHELGTGLTPVNASLLAPYSSYGTPKFVTRGYYLDIAFRCAGCGRDEVWTGRQQKWWYEIARGYPYSGAKLCRSCRRRERERAAGARQVHQQGLARKHAAKQPRENS